MTVPADRRSNASAAIVVAVGVTCALHIGKLPVAIPALQVALGISLLQAGFLLSLVQLAGMLFGVFVGLMADRLGLRRVMLVGLVLLAMGSAGGALSIDAMGLLVSRGVEGFGFLLAVLPAPGLIRRVVPNGFALSRALGWWGAYMPLGTALALLFGAPIVDGLGWRSVWLALSLLCAVAALVLWRCVPGDAPAAGSPASALTRLDRTLRSRGPWMVAIAFLLYSSQWIAVVGFLPTVLAQAGLAGAALGALSALAAAVNMVGNIAAGRWTAAGAPPWRILLLGFGAMGASALLAFGLKGWPFLQFGAVLVFSGVGGLIPGTLFGLAVRLAPGPDTVSTTVGWMQQLSALGQFAGPPVVAWTATLVGGWHFTGWITATASLLGMALAWRLKQVHQ